MTLSKETRDDLQSLITRFSEVGKLPQGGVTRLAYTPLEDEMHRIFREEGKAHGFNVWEDSIGNSFVGNISDEKEPHTLLGSHLDSVIEGGPYDGVVGVAGGFAAMLELKRQGKKIPLVVAAFRCEESSNFQHCTVGSGLMTHALDLQGLQNVVSLEGEKLSDCLARHGYRGEVPVPEGITRYIELHIEQGRVLQENDTQIGIVTAIAAPHRYRLRLQGFSEHSGATPMNLRLDALCAASEVILAVEQIGREESVNASVATVGCIDNHPNIINSVPGMTDLRIDMRGIHTGSLLSMDKALKERVDEICRRRGISYQLDCIDTMEPCHMDGTLVEQLCRAAHAEGLSFRKMPSGAGHDALSFAHLYPTAMVFIPCKDGISHNIAEYTSPEQIEAGVRVLVRFLLQGEGGDKQALDQ
ncbi:MAG: M20 family metallo-hydrolase [Oscillospiraceae bacterium]|nr:M20 family metallo-hydrolase [Oscillospiraceae bacterium]